MILLLVLVVVTSPPARESELPVAAEAALPRAQGPVRPTALVQLLQPPQELPRVRLDHAHALHERRGR